MNTGTTDLHGKSIVVTGASMGVGLEAARVCLSCGARVMLCARGVGALRDAEVSLAREHGADRVASAVADVGQEADVEALFDEFVRRFERCDGVIHAAAILGPIGKITTVLPSEWWEALRIDLFGPFLIARAGARRMQQHGGRMVFFSGGGASGPFPNYSAYACSKVAVVRFVETIAQELAPQIEVNCVAPGFVPTRMHQETLTAGSRAGDEYLERTRAELAAGGISPAVGAKAAAFLVSHAARGITGKFVAAQYDDYRAWPREGLTASDLFTLRRILPRDRGLDWQ